MCSVYRALRGPLSEVLMRNGPSTPAMCQSNRQLVLRSIRCFLFFFAFNLLLRQIASVGYSGWA